MFYDEREDENEGNLQKLHLFWSSTNAMMLDTIIKD